MPDPGTYEDRWIRCTDAEVQVRGYYFPWGSKHIPYDTVRDVERVDLGLFTGKARIWGTANLRYWANLDPGRPKKSVGLVLDLGRSVRPLLTPDDPDTVERILRARAGLGPADGASRPGPVL